MRKELFLAIIKRLKTITSENGLSVIKHFDLWNENVAFIEQEAFAMPAVFVEFPPITWATLPHGVQEATITVNLHVVTGWDSPSSDGSIYQDRALEYFDLLDQINAAMHCFSGENFGSFTRIGSTTNHNHEGIMDSLEVYTTHGFDRSAERK